MTKQKCLKSILSLDLDKNLNSVYTVTYIIVSMAILCLNIGERNNDTGQEFITSN